MVMMAGMGEMVMMVGTVEIRGRLEYGMLSRRRYMAVCIFTLLIRRKPWILNV